jgi:hypothetical protein
LLLAACGACGSSSAAPATPIPHPDAGAPVSDAPVSDAAVAIDGGVIEIPAADVIIPTSCDPSVALPPDSGVCILGANGAVTDLADASLPDLVMTICGGICFGTRSDSTGKFAIPIGGYLDTQNYAMHADGRPDHAVDYLRLAASEPQIITTTMRVPALPPSTVQLPADGAPASTITVGDLTLSVAAGTTFTLDVEDFGTTEGRTLRVAPVPLANAPSHAIIAQVDAIYALAPSGATSSSKMGVTLKNSAGLPASAAVELLVLGDDYFSTPPNVGVLGVQATAHVSADGQTIQTDPGEGINEITWLGVRRKGN